MWGRLKITVDNFIFFLTQDQFISEHGESNIQIWVDIQNQMEDDWARREARLEQFQEMQGEGE